MSHYLIFSKRHTQGIAMWWRGNAAGYTNNLDDAGRYTKEEAESYCAASHGEDVPVRELGAYSLAQRRIVDMGDGANRRRHGVRWTAGLATGGKDESNGRD